MWVSLDFQAPTVMLCSALQREALRFDAFRPAYPLASRKR